MVQDCRDPAHEFRNREVNTDLARSVRELINTTQYIFPIQLPRAYFNYQNQGAIPKIFQN